MTEELEALLQQATELRKRFQQMEREEAQLQILRKKRQQWVEGNQQQEQKEQEDEEQKEEEEEEGEEEEEMQEHAQEKREQHDRAAKRTRSGVVNNNEEDEWQAIVSTCALKNKKLDISLLQQNITDSGRKLTTSLALRAYKHLHCTIEDGDVKPRIIRKRCHRFQIAWKKTYDWLVFSPTANAAFCAICVLFGDLRPPKDQLFVQIGWTTWHDATRSFSIHELRTTHAQAIATARNNGIRIKQAPQKETQHLVCPVRLRPRAHARLQPEAQAQQAQPRAQVQPEAHARLQPEAQPQAQVQRAQPQAPVPLAWPMLMPIEVLATMGPIIPNWYLPPCPALAEWFSRTCPHNNRLIPIAVIVPIPMPQVQAQVQAAMLQAQVRAQAQAAMLQAQVRAQAQAVMPRPLVPVPIPIPQVPAQAQAAMQASVQPQAQPQTQVQAQVRETLAQAQAQLHPRDEAPAQPVSRVFSFPLIVPEAILMTMGLERGFPQISQTFLQWFAQQYPSLDIWLPVAVITPVSLVFTAAPIVAAAAVPQ